MGDPVQSFLLALTEAEDEGIASGAGQADAPGEGSRLQFYQSRLLEQLARYPVHVVLSQIVCQMDR